MALIRGRAGANDRRAGAPRRDRGSLGDVVGLILAGFTLTVMMLAAWYS